MTKPIEPKQRADIQVILGLGAEAASPWVRRRKQMWVGLAVAALLTLAAFWLFGGGSTGVRYVTAPATRGNLTVIVTATGSVQPTNKVDVSSELSGTIRKVLVDYNSPVKAGQVLATLDTDKLVATLNSSKAKLAAAQAKAAEAEVTVGEKRRELARNKTLAATNAVSARDHDQAQAAYDRAVTSLASARADVDIAAADVDLGKTNLAKASITSPINGVVLVRNVDPGQTVASSLQAPVLFSIAEDLKQMELRVDVDEADVGKVRAGQTATFTVDAFPSRKFPATIREVRFASETIQGVVTYKAVLDIDNSELLLRPGMTATAEINVTEVKDALLVPNAALRYAPSAAKKGGNRSLLSQLLPGRPHFRSAAPREVAGQNGTVWLLQDGEPVAEKVVIGASDGRNTEIKSGDLKAGQAVIVDQTASKS